jgi:uncharacterized protein Yka (UPF0111/DUF47 family)
LHRGIELRDGIAMTARALRAITSARRGESDSLHLLVMDVHRALNELQAALSEEDIGGAAVYGITEWDRPRIAAFMAGLASTAALKFNHPGLGTVASRSGHTLVIQNEIGTTDAHVLVLHVDPVSVTVFYTDTHAPRLDFFKSMFEAYAVEWQDTRAQRVENLNQGERFLMCAGRFVAADIGTLDEYLSFLGSRIVFLIDWNRARKRLRRLVKQRAAIRILKWAADENVGHRAFLELGGEDLVREVVAVVSRRPFPSGTRLRDVIGGDSAAEFLRFVLKASSRGLKDGRTPALIRDEIRIDLMGRFPTEGERTFRLLLDHAWIVGDMASAVESGLTELGLHPESDRIGRMAVRLKRWESDADDLVRRLRAFEAVNPSTDVLRRLATVVDDAADDLEEAAFTMTLLDRHPESRTVAAHLHRLGTLVTRATREFLKVVDAGRSLAREADRRDVRDLLAGIDRVIALEREADQAERAALAEFVSKCDDGKLVTLAARAAGSLEAATDALRHAAEILHDQMLNQMMR